MTSKTRFAAPSKRESAPKRCFAPVIDIRTRLLVLGSLPGEASLAAGRYYAHPRNQFWALIGTAAGIELAALAYEERLERLLEAGIGLWDVIASAARRGSLDAAIRDPVPNALGALVAGLPKLRAVAFNGSTAARIGRRALECNEELALVDLPSSSPARAMPFESKRDEWLKLSHWLYAPRGGATFRKP